MEIKEYLKTIHMTQRELADRLGLSRPTLDTYIQLFQNQEKIPKERYQVVFEKLFTQPPLDGYEFRQVLDDNALFLKQEQVLGVSSEMGVKQSYILSMMMQEVRKDLCKKDADWNVYTFFNLVLRNYRKNPFLGQLMEYVMLFYGKKNRDEVPEEDKAFLSSLHRLMQNRENLEFQPEAYQDLLDSASRSKRANAETQEEAKRRLMKQVEARMKKLMEEGVDLEKMDLETLMDH